jgi:putative transposase
MSQSLSQLYIHIVFSTKEWRPFLADAELRQAAHAYIAGICSNPDSPAVIVGGVEDHLHALCRLSKSMGVADLIRELKRSSTTWLKAKAAGLAAFHWQSGYGAFSVSPSHVGPLTDYIRNQAEHHRRETFQDEFRRLLNRYGIEFDERYVWD